MKLLSYDMIKIDNELNNGTSHTVASRWNKKLLKYIGTGDGKMETPVNKDIGSYQYGEV